MKPNKDGLGEIEVKLNQIGMVQVRNSATGQVFSLYVEEATQLHDLLGVLLKKEALNGSSNPPPPDYF